MARFVSLSWLAASLIVPCALARSWKDVVLIHDANPKDTMGLAYLDAVDPRFDDTMAPTFAPTTAVPTFAPTASQAPSASPAPTKDPTSQPSTSPTASPTVTDPYPMNPVPDRPDRWYFNYDTRPQSDHGPGQPAMQVQHGKLVMGYDHNAWKDVFVDPQSYWREFTNNGFGTWKGVLDNRDPLRNRCGRIGMQSPIDLRPNGAKCEEHHEVRSRVSQRMCPVAFIYVDWKD